jgi:excisionase family DNA binding protein
MFMEQTNLLEHRIASAQMLGISLRKLEMLIAEKQLKVVRIGKRVLIPRRELEAFVRKNAQ